MQWKFLDSANGCSHHLMNTMNVWKNNSGKWESKQLRVVRVLEEIIQVASCRAAPVPLASIPSWLCSRRHMLLLSPTSGPLTPLQMCGSAKLTYIQQGVRGLASHLSVLQRDHEIKTVHLSHILLRS